MNENNFDGGGHGHVTRRRLFTSFFGKTFQPKLNLIDVANKVSLRRRKATQHFLFDFFSRISFNDASFTARPLPFVRLLICFPI